MRYHTDDTRITGHEHVIAPCDLVKDLPITPEVSRCVFQARQQIDKILTGEDKRLLCIVGPCSIHDPISALEFAHKLRDLSLELKDELFIIMRVYFEKPRTTVGWKGLINDPNLDGSYDIKRGLYLAREVLLSINALNLPAGTEYLDLITPQYYGDLIAWGAIGARTTESQCHRELASGLSCAVGFKNGTDGRLQIAVDAVRAAHEPHIFLSVTKEGRSAIFSSSGNKSCHIILRGGDQPNYDADSVAAAVKLLESAKANSRLMVDFSHGNSSKVPERQVEVCDEIARQIAKGNPNIAGIMIESHLVGGRQDVNEPASLTFGQSITDACLAWEKTAPCLQQLAEAVKKRSAAKG